LEVVMLRMTRSVGVSLVMLAVASSHGFAQTDNPHVGTWKLNPAKSKYNAGNAPKSGSTRIEAAGAGVKYTVEQTLADGTSLHWEFTANYDGKDVRISGENPLGNTVALTRVDARTVRIVSKQDGKPTVTQMSVVSSDGKSRTVTTKGTSPSGEAVDGTIVYERQ
jgi:hypothetical protein